MNYSEFNQYCENLTSTTYVQQWGNCHVWKVGGKVFAIGGWEKKTGVPAFTFKTSDNHFNLLQDQPGFRPAPYMASRGMKWIQQYQHTPNDRDLLYYIDESYKIVALGLPKKRQKELGLNPHAF